MLGVDVADLLPHRLNSDALGADERRLLGRLREATEEQREQVLRVADVIIPFKHGSDDGPLRRRA